MQRPITSCDAPHLRGTPIEIAYGRRPPDVINVETSDPEQISMELSREDKTDIELQKIAQKTYHESRQADDIRRDLARQLIPTSGPFNPGDNIYYWVRIIGSANKGHWERGKILEDLGTMVSIDNGISTARINKTLVRARNEYPGDIPDLADAELASTNYVCYWSYPVTTENADIYELYTGTSFLTAACAANGLSVANPSNLRQFYSPEDHLRTLSLARPQVLLISPPQCGDWDDIKKKVDFSVFLCKTQTDVGQAFVIMMPERSDYWRIPSVRDLVSRPGINYRRVDLTSFGMSKEMTYPNRTLQMCTNLPKDTFLGSWRVDKPTQEVDLWAPQQRNGVHTQVYPECFSQFVADRLTESLSSRRLEQYDGHHCPIGHVELLDDILLSSEVSEDECRCWLDTVSTVGQYQGIGHKV